MKNYKERLPKGCVGKGYLAGGNITRYYLSNGWFIDKSTGCHRDPLGLYTLWEPGGDPDGGAARRAWGARLQDVLKKAFVLKPESADMKQTDSPP